MARSFALLGVPSSAGARELGQELGPQALRAAGLASRLARAGLVVADHGDLPLAVSSPDPGHPRRRNAAGVAVVARRVAAAVDGVINGAVASGALPLVLGGDCTISIGVLAGMARPGRRLGLVYLDADLDLNTPETTPSGIFDGMGLAHILGEGDDELAGIGERRPLVDASDVVLFGYSVAAGGIDPPELARLATLPAARFPLESVRDDPAGAARAALAALEARVDGFLLHFDIDVIDADEVDAADVPHRPGLALAATRAALAVFASSPRLAGVAVTEYNARRDPGGRQAVAIVETLVAALSPPSSDRTASS